MITINLDTQEDTVRLGSALGEILRSTDINALFYFGSLGAGKTTLTRSIVTALDGGNEAEVSSPSFTICNIYSTLPEIRHFDLYRLPQGVLDETLSESLDASFGVTIVEWSERLLYTSLPNDGLAIRLTADIQDKEKRLAEIGPLGQEGKKAIAKLLEIFPTAQSAATDLRSFFIEQ